MVGSCLLFHSINGFALDVTFSTLLIAYLAFADWQRVADVLPIPYPVPRLSGISAPAAAAVSLATAVAVATLWLLISAVRTWPTLGGLLNWYTVWIPVMPVAMALVTSALLPTGFLRSISLGGPDPRAA